MSRLFVVSIATFVRCSSEGEMVKSLDEIHEVGTFAIVSEIHDLGTKVRMTMHGVRRIRVERLVSL